MKTWVKIFYNDYRPSLEDEINDYAKENCAEIVSTSISVRPFDYGSDSYVVSVVFKGEKSKW